VVNVAQIAIARIEKIVAPLLKRWPNINPDALQVGSRKQATVPVGAEILEPVGTAPGLVVTPGGGMVRAASRVSRARCVAGASRVLDD
jgi:molybdopterin-biosynthesis enzyme MoeA-like protein